MARIGSAAHFLPLSIAALAIQPPIRQKPRPSKRLDIPKAIRRRSLAHLSAAELFVGSFALLVGLGTLGFKFLPGLYTGEPMGWLDAAFTVTSAVCVTGLIVVDTATYFTFAGQLYLLLLIQLGGLGILTFASLILNLFGKRASLSTELAVASSREVSPTISMRAIIRDIVFFTVVCEGLGALALFCVWAPQMGWKDAMWPAVFHSVSAFCNAGFSTNTLSLIPHAHSPATLLIISALIIAGGIGFITLEELTLFLRRKRSGRRQRLSTHSKLVLTATLILLFFPTFLFAFFEWERTLAGMAWTDKWTNALFMSVTPRTAGFNAIDYGQAADSTNLLTILLMAIGGSPGSTAGGMKTTTVFLLGLLAWSKIRSQRVVSFFDRSIPDTTVQQATGLFVVISAITIAGVFLTVVADDPLGEDHLSLHRIFEVVSAFNTVGLSMGITPQLSAGAKLILIAMMFIGRVGPLSVSSAFEARFAKQTGFRLANENVIIG